MSRVCAEQSAEELLGRVLAVAEVAEGAWTRASVLHYPGSSGLAGPYQGRDSVLGLLRRLSELSGTTFEFVPDRVVADSDSVLVRVGKSRGACAGRKLSVRTMQILSRLEGEVREAWLFYADQARVDDFWSS